MVFFDFAFGADDFGVDQSGERLIVFVLKVVADDDDALIDAELRSGHGGGKFVRMLLFPLQGILNHIVDDSVGFVGDFADAGRFLAQAWVGGGNKFSHMIIIAYLTGNGGIYIHLF